MVLPSRVPDKASPPMNKNLGLLALCQGLFLTNNVTFIAINGLVGLALAPLGWMATLPVMGYVVGGALSTGVVAQTQQRFGRKASFQAGLVVALLSALLCAYAAVSRNFWLLCFATLVAGYYNANANLYRFAAAELAAPHGAREGRVAGDGRRPARRGGRAQPGRRARATCSDVPFAGAYLALAVVALLAMALLSFIDFPPAAAQHGTPRRAGRCWRDHAQPVFIVAAAAGALGYGVMNLLMAATPIAMQQCALAVLRRGAGAAVACDRHVRARASSPAT